MLSVTDNHLDGKHGKETAATLDLRSFQTSDPAGVAAPVGGRSLEWDAKSSIEFRGPRPFLRGLARGGRRFPLAFPERARQVHGRLQIVPRSDGSRCDGLAYPTECSNTAGGGRLPHTMTHPRRSGSKKGWTVEFFSWVCISFGKNVFFPPRLNGKQVDILQAVRQQAKGPNEAPAASPEVCPHFPSVAA